MQRIGVTGGSGFIGGHVIEELLQRGYEVVLFDRFDKRPDKWIAKVAKVFFFQGDIRDAAAVTEFGSLVDGIIHLAGVLGTQETINNPRPAVETNIMGAINVFEAAAQHHLPVANIGVGNHFMNNSYAISKSTAERLGFMFNNDRGGKITTLRAVNAYGPRQTAAAPYGPSKVRKITPAFICRALSSQPIEVYGDGNQVSDMVYVGDVARALVQTLITTNMSGPLNKTVEIGPDEHTTVAEMAALVAQLCEARGYAQAGIKHLPMRPGEIAGAQVIADNSTLGAIGMDIGQLTPLEKGLEQTIDWFIDKKDILWREPLRA